MTEIAQITETHVRKFIDLSSAGFISGLGKPVAGEMCVEAALCAAFDEPHGDKPTCVSLAQSALSITLNDKGWSSPTTRANGLRRLAIAQLGTRDTLDDDEFLKRLRTHCIQKFVPVSFRAAAELHHDETHKAALLSAAATCETDPTLANARAAREVARAASASADAYADASAYAYAYAYASASADAYAYAYAYASASADAYADASAYAYAYAYASASAYAYAYASASAYAYASADAYAYAVGVGGVSPMDKMLSEFAEVCVQILIDMKAPGCEFLFLAEAA